MDIQGGTLGGPVDHQHSTRMLGASSSFWNGGGPVRETGHFEKQRWQIC
jgi:hypothetical protein